MGVGLRANSKGLEHPPNLKADTTAPMAATTVVMEQKSAKAVVLFKPRMGFRKGRAEHQPVRTKGL